MLLGSQTLNPQQAINFCNCESFRPFVPVDKNEQVWFHLMDRKTGEIVKKVAMTHEQADYKNAIIRDMAFAWIRV